MAGVVQGKNCIIKFNLLGDFLPIVCAKSFELNTVTDTVETTTQGLGYWKTFDYDALGYTISLEDVVKIKDDTAVVLFDMMTAQTQFIEVGFQIFYIDDNLVNIIITGTAIVTNTSVRALASDLLTDTIELQGQGEYTLERIVDPVVFRVVIAGDSYATVLIRLLNVDSDIILNKFGLVTGDTKDYFIPKGLYAIYTEIRTTGEDNNLTIDTPAAVNIDFDGDEDIDLPSHRDFFAMRTATYTIGATPPPPCIDVAIVGSPALPDGATGTLYEYSFSLTGTAPLALTINSKPAWMTITLVGSSVSITGTPTEAGTGVSVDIDITNCSAGTVNFTDTFDVTEEEFTSFDWSYAEDGANGSLTIRLNGDIIVNVLANDSGSLAIDADDELDIRVSGISGATRYLKVEDTTAVTVLYEHSQTTGVNSYVFNAVANHHYLITSTVSA